ncbi:hypothetical protein BDR06DRAFT_900429, partial [Suillus hirtellus]
PFELVHGRYVDVSMAHEFGTTVLIHMEKAGKLETHAKEARFIGMDTESKGYRVYWEGKCQVSVEWNITSTNDSPTLALAPSMPTKEPLTQDTPPVPRPTRMCPPPGYYTALHEGETVTFAAALDQLEDGDDKGLT